MAREDQLLKHGVDLTNCDREPIHIPGSIQPHGVLLGLDFELKVQVASANCATLLGVDAKALLGRPLGAVVDSDSHERVHEATRAPSLKQVNPLKLAAADQRFGVFDAILHRSGGLLILELEPFDASDHSFKGFYHSVQKAIVRIQTATSMQELCEAAAEEVRRLTGFDRVMVYRFHPDWHGEVVAEARRADLEPFLGLHYPASDIPAQARRLYETNWLRLIYDVRYRPAPLVPPLNPADGRPLDLSHSLLRSVSPIHCEYLQNMGVSASMSISLMRDGTSLGGLIACHHYSPKLVPYEARLASEFLGQTLSLLVSSRERLEVSESLTKFELAKTALIERAFAAEDFVEGLLRNECDILGVTGADGVAVMLDERLLTAGVTPSPEHIVALARASGAGPEATFVTHALPSLHPSAAVVQDTAAGLLSVRLGGLRSTDRILWFRGEFIQTVDWAGAPKAAEALPGGEVRLSPRGSFSLWRETVRGQSKPWTRADIEAGQSVADAINRIILAKTHEIKQLNDDLREASRAKDEFLAVVSHELRTPLNAILGWTQLLKERDSEEEVDEGLATIERSARAQQRLIEDLLDVSRIISGKLRLAVESVDPHEIVKATLESIRPAAEAKRIRLQVVLDSDAGTIYGDPTRFQQVVWNLLSNAVKFTARDGRVYVRLAREASSIVLEVADNGEGIDPGFLPFVFDRFRQADGKVARRHQGLGLGLAIVRHLVELHGGAVVAESEGLGKGATFRVRLPIAPVGQDEKEKRPARRRESKIECPPELHGLRILVVDDDKDARLVLTRILTRCHMKVTEAPDALAGLELLRRERPDVLISDIGMPDVDGYELIRRVRDLPQDEGALTPSVALTAFARAEDRTKALMAGFTTHITKPVAPSELLAVLASVVGRNLKRP